MESCFASSPSISRLDVDRIAFRTAPPLPPIHKAQITQTNETSEVLPMAGDPSTYQIGGDHYQGRTMQPWDIIEAWDLDFWEGNALKYLLRRKPGVDRVEDLSKAIHYLEKCVERASRHE